MLARGFSITFEQGHDRKRFAVTILFLIRAHVIPPGFRSSGCAWIFEVVRTSTRIQLALNCGKYTLSSDIYRRNTRIRYLSS